MSDRGPVVIKCSLRKDPVIRRAFLDEYRVMRPLSHPGIPSYYAMVDHFNLPDRDGQAPALCMEDCSASPLPHTEGLLQYTQKPLPHTEGLLQYRQDPLPQSASRMVHAKEYTGGPQPHLEDLSWPEVISVLDRICDLLAWLLDHGVLYTDLNPSNIILRRLQAGQGNADVSRIHVFLVDYTFCYFFLENPYPEYSLRFSYNLSPDLKGQQLLIQEMTLLLQDLADQRADSLIPSAVCRLIEAGKNPPEHLSLPDYSSMIKETQKQTS